MKITIILLRFVGFDKIQLMKVRLPDLLLTEIVLFKINKNIYTPETNEKEMNSSVVLILYYDFPIKLISKHAIKFKPMSEKKLISLNTKKSTFVMTKSDIKFAVYKFSCNFCN